MAEGPLNEDQNNEQATKAFTDKLCEKGNNIKMATLDGLVEPEPKHIDDQRVIAALNARLSGVNFGLLAQRANENDSTVIEPLLHILETEDEYIRSFVVRQLEKLTDHRARTILIKIFKHDKSERIRFEAYSALERQRYAILLADR